jgi:hypothetical protein
VATPRKKPSPRKVKTVESNEYNRLEVYCIWLNEYYNALLRAGFKSDVAMGLIVDKTSYPDWVSFKIPSESEISNYLDEDED